MTSQDFIEVMGALHLNRKHMAAALGKRGPTITGYMNGKPIPVDVAERIQSLLKQERERIQRAEGLTLSSVGSMIVYQNERKKPALHQTFARFGRRQRPPDTRTFPTYRMSRERFGVYLEALSKWAAHVRELAREYTDHARQRDYALELADLKQLAETAPRNAPYDVCITRTEWDVVSRALRHLAASGDHQKYRDAHALRVHWLKYRGSGFPKHRSTQEGQTDDRIIQA